MGTYRINRRKPVTRSDENSLALTNYKAFIEPEKDCYSILA